MRPYVSFVGILATLTLGTLVQSAPAASNPTPVKVDTNVEVNSASATGLSYTAPVSGVYHFTIVSGSYCYLSQTTGATSPFGGWLTEVQIFTKPVAWGAADQWGKHPIQATAAVGDAKHQPTSAEAEAAGKGATVAVKLSQGDHVTLIISDGHDFYYDNKGSIKIHITAEASSPTKPPAQTGSILVLPERP